MNPHYKKVIGFARNLGLRDSLHHIWAYGLQICFRKNLPAEYTHQGVRGTIHEHHLDLHVREILMHAGSSAEASASLRHWDDLATFHNLIHEQGGKLAKPSKDIYLTLHRIGHQQATSWDAVGVGYLGRYWLLLRQPRIAALIYKSFGMTVEDYFLFVAGLFTIFMRIPESDLAVDLASLGLPTDAVRNRIAVLTTTRANISTRLAKRQRFDTSWEYTFNELALTPLIKLRASEQKLFCPRPPLLVRRLLAGVYFDLVNEDGFGKAFGDAVEVLVGDLIRRSDPNLVINKPEPYRTASGVRHGADWAVADSTADIFVECKTARIPLSAQVAVLVDDVWQGMGRLADAIVQNYANIEDARNGRTQWRDRSLPVYSMVVTLEDWNLFSPTATQALRDSVKRKLSEKRLNASMIESYPYVVVSVRELPDLMHVAADVGIDTILGEKSSENYSQYMVSPYLDETGRKSDFGRKLFGSSGLEFFEETKKRLGLVL